MIGDSMMKTKLCWFVAGFISAAILSSFSPVTVKTETDEKVGEPEETKRPVPAPFSQVDINKTIFGMLNINGKITTYQDADGTIYCVKTDNLQFFRAFSYEPTTAEKAEWEPVEALPWRTSYDEAQRDLDELAQRENWQTTQKRLYIDGMQACTANTESGARHE